MKIINLKGTNEEIELIQENLRNRNDVVFMLDKDIRIYDYLRKLEFDSIFLHRLKICNNVNFDFKVILRNKETSSVEKDYFKDLSEVIRFIGEGDYNKYSLILCTDDYEKLILSSVIQQLIYLGISLEVMLEKEEKERQAMKVFKEHFQDIKTSVTAARKTIDCIDVKSGFAEDKNTFTEILSEIESELITAEKRELTLSVMATKKSGKSVVVNSFLEEEYAPTSLVLATPNTCIYKSTADKQISLDYKGERRVFNSPEDIRNYIGKEFEQAQSCAENGFMLEDMQINYVTDKNSLMSYTIMDTPGPDLAGSSHRDIAYKSIESSDVVLFVVDYTKHLTEGEEAFLRDIKTSFEKYDKFYSFIVIVNKMDEVFMNQNNVDKSVTGFLDYLRFKLDSLGYKSYVVFGASALQYFYSVQAPQIPGCESLNEVDNRTLLDNLNDCIDKYIGQKEMTTLNFIDVQLKNLRRFYGIKDSNLETLKQKSGMVEIINYTNYVASQKANVELMKSVLRKIDEKFSRLKNKLLFFELSRLNESIGERKEKREEIIGKINELILEFKSIKLEIKEELSMEVSKKEFHKDFDDSRTQIAVLIYQQLEHELDMKRKKLEKMTQKELEVEKEVAVSGDRKLIVDLNVLDEQYTEKLGMIQRSVSEKLDEMQDAMGDKDQKIKKLVSDFSQYIGKKYPDMEFDITMPKLDVAFTKMDFKWNNFTERELTNKLNKIINNTINREKNFFDKLISFITRKKIDKASGKYSIDKTELINEFNLLLSDARLEIWKQVEINNRELGEYVDGHINELSITINEEAKSMIESYEKTFMDLRGDLESSLQGVEQDIESINEKISLYENVKNILSSFFDEWNKIRLED
ncbi:dynamin family protein [Clostridium sp. PL3]|uniref:Dynamin family protein n=1 Tax=Clostridium thailandense TaxID=2794346 RepID=A0A949U448_9CLOT|nr:dynamin family protein [Clostridium thailandense]MBV7276118.1 dynamin family protein [Clostridium thailandense]